MTQRAPFVDIRQAILDHPRESELAKNLIKRALLRLVLDDLDHPLLDVVRSTGHGTRALSIRLQDRF